MLKKGMRTYVKLTLAKHEEDTHEDERVWPDSKLGVFLMRMDEHPLHVS
jgi:hypothetical protein